MEFSSKMGRFCSGRPFQQPKTQILVATRDSEFLEHKLEGTELSGHVSYLVDLEGKKQLSF
jgi:hypothetical protein